MPLFHLHGLVASTFAALAAGGTVVAPRRLTPQRFWKQAREAGTTWLSAGPTLHQMLLDKIDSAGAPGTLRFVRSCSSALSPELLRRAERSYGLPMLESHGMTEASHQMAANPLPPGERVPSSVGVPVGTEIGIVDATGSVLPAGQAGEVVIRGPGVMSGISSPCRHLRAAPSCRASTRAGRSAARYGPSTPWAASARLGVEVPHVRAVHACARLLDRLNRAA